MTGESMKSSGTGSKLIRLHEELHVVSGGTSIKVGLRPRLCFLHATWLQVVVKVGYTTCLSS